MILAELELEELRNSCYSGCMIWKEGLEGKPLSEISFLEVVFYIFSSISFFSRSVLLFLMSSLMWFIFSTSISFSEGYLY